MSGTYTNATATEANPAVNDEEFDSDVEITLHAIHEEQNAALFASHHAFGQDTI